MKGALTFGLAIVPVVLGWFLGFRLSAYRRERDAVSDALWGGGLWRLRPDQYTEEGQSLLRWVWLLMVLAIPWIVGVLWLLGFP